MMTYGGDEVNALVLDVGSSSVKAGFSGQDAPCAVFDSAAVYTTSSGSITGDAVHCYRDNAQVKTPWANGDISDWDTLETLLDHAFSSALRVDPANHALLMTEPAWLTKGSREKLSELLFEKYQVPALYLAKAPVLSAFASGRSTALVLDMGASSSTVTPVYDGYILRKGDSIQVQHKGGDYLSDQTIALLNDLRVPLTPQYKVKSKLPVDQGAPPNFTPHPRRSSPHPSFHRLQLMRTILEFKETLCGVFEVSYNEDQINRQPKRAYEFPDGFNTVFGAERFKVAELMFNPAFSPKEDPFRPVQDMLLASAAACDPDLRPHLYGNIVVAGGNSLWPGFSDRLNYQLTMAAPGSRFKIYTPGHTTERKYSAWLGGSILSSLGTFHQMWIGKKEFEEGGKAIIEKRCV